MTNEDEPTRDEARDLHEEHVEQYSRTRYLGDSVYIEIERGMLKLTTNNGMGATNTIYIEATVYQELVRYADEIGLKRP